MGPYPFTPFDFGSAQLGHSGLAFFGNGDTWESGKRQGDARPGMSPEVASAEGKALSCSDIDYDPPLSHL